MKKENAKKSKLWIVLVIVAALLLVAGGVAAFFLMGQGSEPAGPQGGRAEIYWNVDRVKYTEGSATGLSTREPEADGLYHMTFAIDGSQVEFTCADKKVVNRIDMNPAVGLVFDADGVIVDAVSADTIATLGANNMYVQYMEGNTITVNSSVALNGMEMTFEVSDVTGIYNCSEYAQVVGEVGEVQPMDMVLIYQNDLEETTHVFVAERAAETKVYWRLERKYSSSTAATTRTPDENGVYTIGFAVEGEHVELKCKDQAIVNAIDKKQTYNCAQGFLFDEEGYIIEMIAPGMAVKGAAYATNMDITELTETSFVATKQIPGTGQGTDYNGIITPETKWYNVNSTCDVMGEETKPQMGDRLYVLANTKGEAVQVFVVNRRVDSPLYYNPSVKYDETNLVTTRTPDSQGRYVYDLYYEGTNKITVWTKDIKMASRVDSEKYGGFGLKISEDNEILKVYSPSCVTGYSTYCVNLFVTNVAGKVVAAMTYVSNKSQSGVMADDCKVYDYSDMATVKGEETQLRVNDRIVGYRNEFGQFVEIHVILRQAPGTELYFNLNRKYDSTKKVTTREPVGGWYVFDVVKEGKQMTVKTSDKALASKIDSYSPAAVALRVENGVVYECWPGHRAVGGGYQQGSNYIVREFDKMRSTYGSFRCDYTTVSLTPNVYRNRWLNQAEEMKVYNVSQNYVNYRGEETTLQIGDRIHAIRDMTMKIVVVFVLERDISTGPAFMSSYKYNSDTGETTRTPDEDGWYRLTIARDGKVAEYKTKDKALVSKIDATGDAFAFTNKGDIITNVLPISYIKGVDKDTATRYDIMEINKNSVVIQKNRPVGSDIGKKYTFKLSPNVKVYDGTTRSETFGKEIKLEVGDRIHFLINNDKVVQYIIVMQQCTREAGPVGTCEHCGQEVWWEPWYGGTISNREGIHYYLCRDTAQTTPFKIYNEDDFNKPKNFIIDLNGYAIETKQQTMKVQNGSTLAIMDTSKAQTGVIRGKGTTTVGGINGGGIFVYGGNVEMYGGTLEMREENHHNNKQGGIMYIANSPANAETGKPAFAASVKLLGGKIVGTDANTAGGAIYQASGTLEIGGDMLITGGVAPKGNCVYSTGASSELIISGNAQILGGMQVGSTGKVTISGKPQILAGETSEYSLNLPNDVDLELGKLEEGAKIGITTFETFTKALADEATAKAYAKYFFSDDAKKTIVVQDNCLATYQPPLEAPETCLHCGEQVEWIRWNGDKFTQGGHYYMANDVKLSASITISDTESDFHVILDLNGCKLESADKAFMVTGNEKLTIMDSSEEKTGTVIGVGRNQTITHRNAGVIQVYKGDDGNGELEILGGTYILTEGTWIKSGGVIYANAGTSVYVKDATLIGANCSGQGGVIYANGANVTLAGKTYITGGKVIDLTGEGKDGVGDNIYATSGTNLTIADEVKIDGGVQIASANSVTLTGTPTILKTEGGSEYSMKLIESSPKLDVSGLEAAAKIGVTAEGIFTQKADEAIADCFVSDDPSVEIQMVGGAISAGEDEGYATREAVCPQCGQNVVWEAWDGSKPVADCHLYLSDDLKLNDSVSISDTEKDFTVVLDLNGKELSSKTKVFLVQNSETLVIIDSSDAQTGKVIGTGKKNVDVSSANNAGVIQLYKPTNGTGGNLKLLGGTYMLAEGCVAKNGGIIYAGAGNTIYIKDATLIGATANQGGAIYANNTDVTLEGNTVIKAGSAAAGDSIYITTEGELTISGQVTIDGGVQVTSTAGQVTLAGSIAINKNLGNSAYSLKLGENLIDATGLSATAGVGITKTEKGIFTTEFADEAAANLAKGVFFADDDAIEIVVSDKALSYGEVEIVEPPVEGEDVTAYCEHCGQTVTWTAWDGTKPTADAHLYLPEGGLTLDACVTIGDAASNFTVVLDLKGQTLTNSTRAFLVQTGETLYIVDSVGGGEVKGVAAKYASIAQVYNGGHVIITGGTFTQTACPSANVNGGMFYVTGKDSDGTKSSLTLLGGTFQGAQTNGQGAVAYVNATELTVGGNAVVKAGTAGKANGGDTFYITAAGSVAVFEGNAQIEGGVALSGTAGSVTVQGAPVIQKTAGGSAYSLRAGASITVGALTEGASIGITRAEDGTFTTTFADAAAAEAAKAFFTADEAGKEITVEGDLLKVADIATEPEPTEPEATEATTAPTEATTVAPTEATTVAPTEATTEATTAPTEATTAPTEATTAPTEATTAPTQPAGEACEHCGQVVEWTAWDGLTFTQSGHYIVPEGGLNLTAQAKVSDENADLDVVLDLNGQTVTSTAKVFFIANDDKLTVLDSSEGKTGTVIGTGAGAKKHAGVIQLYKGDGYPTNGELVILGGTFKQAEGSQSSSGGVIYANAGAKLTIKNATIEGGIAKIGGALYINNAQLTIGEGAVIKAGTASDSGDSIYITTVATAGQVTIEGNAQIEGGLQLTSTATGVVIKDTVSIQKVANGSAYSLKLGTATVDFTGLKAGASVGITMTEDGVFTADFADEAAAEAAKALFTSDDAAKEIAIEGKALKVAAIATEPEPTEATTEATTAPTEETTAPTEATTEATAPAGEPTCPVCGEVEWTAWDGTAPTANAHVYIPEGGVALADGVTISTHVVIDLKGNAITSAKQVLRPNATGDLHIIDSVGTGTVTAKANSGRHGGIFQFTGAGTLSIYGGTYALSADEVFKDASYNGGLLYIGSAGGNLNISGGTFTGTAAKQGGMFYTNGGTITISGGEFFPGTSANGGDGMYFTGGAGVVTISGGTFHGGVQIGSAKATISGAPVILKTETGAYSLKGKVTVGELTEGAQIGVTVADDGAFTTEFETPVAAAAAVKYFVADEAGKEVRASGTELVVQTIADIAAATCDCAACNGAAPTWTAWDGQNITAGGHYYLAEDMAVSATMGVGNAEGEDFTVVFNLNGKTLTSTVAKKIFQVKNGETMIVVDSSAQGTGAMVGNPGTAHAGVIQAYGGHIVFQGGNFYLSSDKATTVNGGIVYASSGGTITCQGGEFWGGNYTKGGVFAQTGGVVEITGGIIHAGKATNGDSIYVTSGDTAAMTLNIGGTAVIEGGVDVYTGKSAVTVNISGKPVIEKVEGGSAYSLKLVEGVVITVGTLEEGAKIAVTAADGAFTAAFADEAAATAAAAYFTADDATKAIKVADLALVIGAAEAAA